MNINNKNNSLNRRRDVRSVEQFKHDIKTASLREQMLIKLWQKEMQYRGHIVTYENFGVDNSGEFVEKSDARPDFKVIEDGKEYLLELKCNPFDHKQTFKLHDLYEYIRYTASMLLFYGVGHNKSTVDYDTTRWGIISHEAIGRMINDIPARKGDAKWGYKEVVILYPRHYDAYWEEERLTHVGTRMPQM
jgi:hypothetical protein